MKGKIDPLGIYECFGCRSFVYGQDAKIVKGKPFCIVCYREGMRNIYDNRKSKIKGNFLLLGLPLAIAILFWIFAVLCMAFPDSEWLAYIMLGCLGAYAVNIFISAYLFTSKFDLMSEIGDPEGILIEVSGKYDPSTNSIDGTGRVYDTYTAGQTLSMLGNIFKFLLISVVIAFVGWIFFFVLLIRLNHTKKLLHEADIDYDATFGNKYKVTCALCCHGPFEDEDASEFEYVVNDLEGNEYANLTYQVSLVYENKIACLCTTSDKHVLIFYILPGYKHQIVDDDETYGKIKAHAVQMTKRM